MAEEKKELTKLPSGDLVAAPSFMDADQAQGTQEMLSKLRPSWMKLIQKQASEELITTFGVGSLVLVPDNILVWTTGDDPLRIVPVFHFSEYAKFSSLLLKDSEPMIVERSTNPDSDLARRANDPRLWSESHPQHQGDSRYDYRYVHSLIFLCVFQNPALRSPMPFTLSFAKGSFGRGQSFCGKIVMRRKPIYGSVFELSVDPRLSKNTKGEWREYLLENPRSDPWVNDPAEYAEYKALHQRLAELHAANSIEVHDEGLVEDDEEATPY